MTVTFKQLGLNSEILRAVTELGYVRPTPIQVDAIPIIMEGRDLIGCAHTGTGKTAAFLLPILHRIMGKTSKSLKVLILEPTRELASQVEEQIDGLAKFIDIRALAVFGGVGMGQQERAFINGLDIVVATPGRLLDHISRGSLNLNSVEFLVLDEADRMLDMGFLPDVRKIIKKVSIKRQSLLFSATIPFEVERLAWEYMHHPAIVRAATKDEVAVGITHAIYPVPEHLKNDLLMRLLQEHPIYSVLIFTRTKIRADRLAQKLYRAGFPVMVMHSDRTQRERQMALLAFRRRECQILVATDLAARGLDVEKVSHVINYDVPATAEDYLHRVGRTGRAGAFGDAFTLVAPLEEIDMWGFEQKFGMRLPRVVLPDFDYDVEATGFKEDDIVQRQRQRPTMKKYGKDSKKNNMTGPKGEYKQGYPKNESKGYKKDVPRQGASREYNAGQDRSRTDTPRPYANRQDAPRQGASREYNAGQDRSRTDTPRPYASRQDVPRQDSAKTEYSKSFSGRQENHLTWVKKPKREGLTVARSEKQRNAHVMLTPAVSGNKQKSMSGNLNSGNSFVPRDRYKKKRRPRVEGLTSPATRA